MDFGREEFYNSKDWQNRIVCERFMAKGELTVIKQKSVQE